MPTRPFFVPFHHAFAEWYAVQMRHHIIPSRPDVRFQSFNTVMCATALWAESRQPKMVIACVRRNISNAMARFFFFLFLWSNQVVSYVFHLGLGICQTIKPHTHCCCECRTRKHTDRSICTTKMARWVIALSAAGSATPILLPMWNSITISCHMSNEKRFGLERFPFWHLIMMGVFGRWGGDGRCCGRMENWLYLWQPHLLGH